MGLLVVELAVRAGCIWAARAGSIITYAKQSPLILSFKLEAVDVLYCDNRIIEQEYENL